MNDVTAQQFGGTWTEEKLECVRKYLSAYMAIFRANKYARKYATLYVDAFAGTGYRCAAPDVCDDASLFAARADEDGVRFLDGSAANALLMDRPFDHYVFIEADEDKAKALEGLKERFPALKDRIKVEPEDANKWLPEWCKKLDWRKHRAVVFLDPYATEVEWSTVEALAGTHGTDLWLLFPLSATNRLLTRKTEPPESWGRRLDRVFGTGDWRTHFYPRTEVTTLFGTEEAALREADFESITGYVISRLLTVFPCVTKSPLVLRNSKNVPLFLLCFASHKPVALKIAGGIIRKRSKTIGYGS
jgi:three-Cys-motif partner protein